MKPIRVVCALALIPVLALMSAHGLPAAASEDPKIVSQSIVIARSGTQPSMRGDAHNFTGAVRIDPLFLPKASSRVSAAYVTFEPGARTASHTHPVGQTFIITAGTGLVQRWGDEVQEIHPGDVVWIPPGQKHWHGASPTTAMTHIAIQEELAGKNVEWMEPVTDEQYRK